MCNLSNELLDFLKYYDQIRRLISLVADDKTYYFSFNIFSLSCIKKKTLILKSFHHLCVLLHYSLLLT